MIFFSKRVLYISLAMSLFLPAISSQAEVFIEKPMDYHLDVSNLPKLGEVYYAYGMFDNLDWQERPEAKLLHGDKDPDVSKEIKEIAADPERAGHDKALKRISTVRLFEYQASFVLDKPVDHFDKNFLADMKTIKNSNKVLVNERKISHLEASEMVSDTHFMKRKNQYGDNEFYPEGFYVYADIKIPNTELVRSFFADYFPMGLENILIPNIDNYKVRTMSRYSFGPYDQADVDLFLKGGAPFTDSTIHSFLIQELAFSDRIIRFLTATIFFQEIPGNRTLVTVKSVAAFQAKHLKKRWGNDIEEIFLYGLKPNPEQKFEGIEGIVPISNDSVTNIIKNLLR